MGHAVERRQEGRDDSIEPVVAIAAANNEGTVVVDLAKNKGPKVSIRIWND
jgi:hypothetical protein